MIAYVVIGAATVLLITGYGFIYFWADKQPAPQEPPLGVSSTAPAQEERPSCTHHASIEVLRLSDHGAGPLRVTITTKYNRISMVVYEVQGQVGSMGFNAKTPPGPMPVKAVKDLLDLIFIRRV
jgi:hypothetical protein